MRKVGSAVTGAAKKARGPNVAGGPPHLNGLVPSGGLDFEADVERVGKSAQKIGDSLS